MRFYRLAGRWYQNSIYQEWQEYNPFRWEIRFFCWGIII
jgi:hypothetical protein